LSVGANSKSILPFIAELNGKPIATGSMSIYEDVAILCGASTIPESRNQGAQNALLEARLAHAHKKVAQLRLWVPVQGANRRETSRKMAFV
jgi:hypothetical protein